ncbi:serine hydrolase [Candidatus Saccharibacteria bacterium TM7i]|nr:serine hydrolase [Candidatus Saccharibacteria bacterium TM7i]
MSEGYHKTYSKFKAHGEQFAKSVHYHALSTPKKIALSAGGAVLVAVLIFQFMFPTDTILPFAKIDSVAVGGKQKQEVVKLLDRSYAEAKVPIYFSSDTKLKVAPSYADLGVKVGNEQRVKALDYPWYVRLVPSSILWYGLIDQSGSPEIARDSKKLDSYFADHFGANCTLEPVNATISVKDEKLTVEPSISGGTCDYKELHPKLEKVAVQLHPEKIIVKGTTKNPVISDEMAEKEKKRLKELLDQGVKLQVGDKTEQLNTKDVYTWLGYVAEEGKLLASLDAQKAEPWLEEKFGKQLAIAPGTTKVVTRDFTEISRVNGTSGQAIDTSATRQALEHQLRGKTDVSKAATKTVAPKVQYERSYSPTDEGLSALLKNFAESHSGSYGISMVELGGRGRRADYNATAQFTTASTYKLFVVYSAMLRVESGSWRLTDQISGGRDLAKCIDDTIVQSDNACAEAMLKKIGYSQVTNEARAIGATSTSFLGSNGIKSTARDEAIFMGALYSGQLLSQQSSRDRIIGALKRNVYRKGIPAGLPGIAVADKVGFLDGLLHDASIVYSPSGAYVLVILTDNSSWANIAELAKQIEALRNA